MDNVAERAVKAVNLDQAIRMRVRGAGWNTIADRCGYSSPAAALRAVGEAMAAATQRAVETADQMRDTAQMQYDALLAETWKMLEEAAPYDADGNQTDDRAVRLRAVDEARRLVDARVKLNGLDKARDEDTDESGIRIVGIDISQIV